MATLTVEPNERNDSMGWVVCANMREKSQNNLCYSWASACAHMNVPHELLLFT